MSDAPPVLQLRSLSVEFGGLRALDSVSLALGRGETVLLVGENGSGKTTLLNAISGFVPCSGSLVLSGQKINKAPTWQRARLGIRRMFQHPRRFSRLRPSEEVGVGLATAKQGRSRSLTARTLALLLALRPLRPSEELAQTNREQSAGFTDARLREFDRLCADRPVVALLDEPFADVPRKMVGHLLERIESLAAGGTAVLIVEHRIDFTLAAASRVVELDRGRTVFDGSKQVFMARKSHPESF